MGKVFYFLQENLIISSPSNGKPLQGFVSSPFPFPRINPGVIYRKALQAFIGFIIKLSPPLIVKSGGLFLVNVIGNYRIYMPFHPFTRKVRGLYW
ncbi:MAG: hypothetical protein GX587_12880 [Bacteroidales bacterium]|nr:hypothetical protein [Bacteroidales bacterium]